MEELEGVVESIIFSADNGGFTVFRLRPEGQHGLVNATIRAEAPLMGQLVCLKGNWIQHPRFGEQFQGMSITVAAPTSLEGIERFLASGAVAGIGPATARRLVEAFGKDTLNIIENHPGRLRQVEGIGQKTAEKIYNSYKEQTDLRDIMLWLEEHQVSGSYAARIFKRYGSFALEVLESDPYRMAREVEGVGFATADTIASKIGIDRDNTKRIAAGIDYVLNRISATGHCCVPEAPLVSKTAEFLGIETEHVWDVLKRQLGTGRLSSESLGGETLVYPSVLYQAEKRTAELLLELQRKAEQLTVKDPGVLVEEWEKISAVNLADHQREAMEAALSHGVLVLTGGPGTGKTTVVRGMIDLLELQGQQITLGAPTGRAAKRLSEATGRKAMTVHRMLEAQGISEEDDIMFARDADEKLEADVIILDEVSMMDIVLMEHFLEAVPDGCHVILVGDVDQLPAVGPGSVLKDILRSEVIHSVRLTEVFRQEGESLIISNAHAINMGRIPECVPDSDFQFIELVDSMAVAKKIVELCTEILPREGFSPMTDIQVLSPMHRQDCGVDNLNKMLQAAVNPPKSYKPEFSGAGHRLRLGDKVIQMKNDYNKHVFNGDIGFIETMEPEKLEVRYSDELLVDYEKGELSALQLAYAMSVHKSQGSEYPVVILPLVPGHRIMLQRNLLYTAITRAKKRVILVGSRGALRTAVENDRTKRRYTLLSERLRHML